ncbi:MAG TPA: radical SAM protein [Candidatus Limnocylindrales bacterium]|nr:radical SAM protein [Candidatus Limnocylindrales bacterium]
MIEALQALRFRFFLARGSLGFASTLFETTYRIYLNHAKVIHYRGGKPVYSLSTPALYTGAAANMLARTIYRSIQNKNLPNMMSLAVNDVCNARCEHCSFFEGVEDPNRAVMTSAQMRKVVHDAQDLGISVLNFVGGEPLLRKDLPEIIRAVDRDRTTTIVFTNGTLLAERAASLRKAGLDSIYVSLDSADPDTNDRFRGRAGLFREAVAGIHRALGLGFSVGISATMTPESFRRGEMARIIELGKRLGVHEVLLFDAMPSGRYADRSDLVDDQGWVEDMIQAAVPYNADRSYPGVLVWAYAAGYRSAGCACGTSYFYVSPYGDVMSCDFNHAVFGNVLATPMWQVWEEMTSREEFREAAWGGCKVKSSRFLETESVKTGMRERSLVS